MGSNSIGSKSIGSNSIVSSIFDSRNMDSRKIDSRCQEWRGIKARSIETGQLKTKGFTLIEVLVALAVFAVASIGLYSVTEQNLLNAARLEEKTMAHWVAMNKMVEIQALPGWPRLGTQDRKVEMAEREWEVKTVISKTSLKTLRKIEIKVGLKAAGIGSDIKTASVLVGYIGEKAW